MSDNQNQVAVSTQENAVPNAVPSVPPSMTYWGNESRGLSNYLIRCALFPVTGNRNPKTDKENPEPKPDSSYKANREIKTDGSFKLTYSGMDLNQSILDIYLEMIHLSRIKGDDGKMYFNPKPVKINMKKALENMGKSSGGWDIKWMHGVIDILKKAEIKISIENDEKMYCGNLISKFLKDGDNYFLELDKDLAGLFGSDLYSRISLDHRKKLKGKNLALWLLNFYTSHKNSDVKRYKTETIYKLSGSGASDIRIFRQSLKKALVDLAKVTNWTCELEDDLITIYKPTTEEMKLILEEQEQIAATA